MATAESRVETITQAWASQDKERWGWIEYKALIESNYPLYDTHFGGHFEIEEESAKASFDWVVGKFGEDGSYTKEAWIKCVEIYYDQVDGLVQEGGKSE